MKPEAINLVAALVAFATALLTVIAAVIGQMHPSLAAKKKLL
jgi:hypothetical protein